jgi:high-affinity Fe2+/Pb2+ permease
VSKEVNTRSSSSTPVSFSHVAAMVAVGVVGAIVAFWILSSIVGIIFFFIKIAVVVALIGGAFWLVSKFRR